MPRSQSRVKTRLQGPCHHQFSNAQWDIESNMPMGSHGTHGTYGTYGTANESTVPWINRMSQPPNIFLAAPRATPLVALKLRCVKVPMK